MEESTLSINIQDNIHAQFLENNVSFWIPSRRNALFEIEIKNKAALKIQSAWRGFQARQLYTIISTDRKREGAASIIQHAVRRWLYGKRQQSNLSIWDRLPQERRMKIQQKLDRLNTETSSEKINKRHNIEIHSEVQRLLNLWYARTPKRESEEQKLESLCAHLEATALIMQGPKSLVNCADIDIEFYRCPSVLIAAEARLRYKREVQTLFAPWWKKLDCKEKDQRE